MPVPWVEVSDSVLLVLFSMLLLHQPGWVFLVSTVFRTSSAIAKRDILLGGSAASKRRWPAFTKAISGHVLALIVWSFMSKKAVVSLAWWVQKPECP